MDITAINAITGLERAGKVSGVERTTLADPVAKKEEKVAEGSLFDSFLNSAINNIKAANEYLSDGENEYIKFAMGETENAHDMTIALQKASAALQYTVAVRDRLLDAYKELMQMQI